MTLAKQWTEQPPETFILLIVSKKLKFSPSFLWRGGAKNRFVFQFRFPKFSYWSSPIKKALPKTCFVFLLFYMYCILGYYEKKTHWCKWEALTMTLSIINLLMIRVLNHMFSLWWEHRKRKIDGEVKQK